MMALNTNVLTTTSLVTRTPLRAAAATRPVADTFATLDTPPGSGMTTHIIRVGIVDDQLLMRCALRTLLEHDPRFAVVESDGGTDAEHCLAHTDLDVVVISAEQRASATLSMIECVHTAMEDVAIVALGIDEQPDRMLQAFAQGATGYLPRSASPEELTAAVLTVAGGKHYLRAEAAAPLALWMRNGSSHGGTSPGGGHPALSLLSNRERAVLTLIARGYSGPQIAAQLGIATKTVDTYRHRIREKTGMHGRAEFVKSALAAGLLA